MVVFDWDQNNLKKIKAHRIKPAEVEQALSREPILVYESAYDLDAGQKRDYLVRRARRMKNDDNSKVQERRRGSQMVGERKRTGVS
jgi:hypothetical protein